MLYLPSQADNEQDAGEDTCLKCQLPRWERPHFSLKLYERKQINRDWDAYK